MSLDARSTGSPSRSLSCLVSDLPTEAARQSGMPLWVRSADGRCIACHAANVPTSRVRQPFLRETNRAEPLPHAWTCMQLIVLPHLCCINHGSPMLWQDFIGGRLATRTCLLTRALLRNVPPYAAVIVVEGLSFLPHYCLCAMLGQESLRPNLICPLYSSNNKKGGGGWLAA